MRRNLYYILFLLLICFSQRSFGQTKVQVVEKTINKKIPLASNETFKVVGEKADILISGWTENYVGLQIVFSAKNADKQTAEKELEYMKYALSNENNVIEVRNTFILPINVNQIKSNLTVNYKVMVPQKRNLNIIDKYGIIEIKGLNGSMNLSSEFADIHLSNVEGTIVIENSFAELRGKDIKGSFTCKAEKSDIYLAGMEGTFIINSSFGNIDLQFEEKLKSLAVKSNRTSIIVQTKNLQMYNYDFSTKYGTIYTPDSYSGLVKKSGSNSILKSSVDSKKPLVTIQTTYSPITIKF